MHQRCYRSSSLNLKDVFLPVHFCQSCNTPVPGVNVVKRKLGEHDNLKITIEQNGDKFHIKESSTFRTKEIDFTLGVQFDYTMADGTDLTGTWVMEGETLKGTFNRKDNNKVLTTTRALVGGELVQVSATH
uniref:Fatty acid binding protein 2 n=1 Tax=Fundulus heteroclitus TaxID=8078 RepID=A0A3Q2T496_FUNHE